MNKTEIRRPAGREAGWVLTVVGTADGDTPLGRTYRLKDDLVHLDREPSERDGAIELKDSAVSAGAVTLERDASGYYVVVDSGSTNPVRVNGREVQRQILDANDVIRVGDTFLVMDRDDPARQRMPDRSFAGQRVEDLLKALMVHGSTAGQLMRVDASLVEPTYGCVAVWSPGVHETRAVAEWLATSWGQTLAVIESVQDGAAERLSSMRPDEAILIDRIDFASPQQMLALSGAIERRLHAPTRSLTIISIDAKLRESCPPVVEQAVAMVAEFELEIPQLAHRKSDLLRSMRQLITQQLESEPLIEADLAEHILTYDWPGELSEFRRTANWLTSIARRGQALNAAALPSSMRNAVARTV